MRRIFYGFLLLILSGYSAFAQDTINKQTKRKWYLPREVKFQYAGNIGFLAGGITYYLTDDWYRLSIMYGNTSMHTSVRTLNTVAFKNTFVLTKFHVGKLRLEPTIGMSINFGSTHNTYRKLPTYFPTDYYFQNKIHFAPFWGGIVYYPIKNNKLIKGIDIYTEIGTIDNYLLECIRTDKVGWDDIWNIALGVSIHLH
jgi:outer membrane protein W